MSEVKGPKRIDPQPFLMVRNKDETGVSGTGVVLEGCVFSDGTVAYTWRSGKKTMSWCVSFETFKELHIDSHPANETEIVWLSQPMEHENE